MTDLEYEIIQLELQAYLIEHNAKLLDYHVETVINELKTALPAKRILNRLQFSSTTPISNSTS